MHAFRGWPLKLQRLLTLEERDRKAELEKVVNHGVRTFVEVGNALRQIRDSQLYRQEFKTFQEYCQAKWGWNASRARQLIGAADVQKSVTTVTLSSERQARELARVPQDLRETVIEVAAARAETEDRALTARDIREAARPAARIETPPEKLTYPSTVSWWLKLRKNQRGDFVRSIFRNGGIVTVESKEELRYEFDQWLECNVVEVSGE